MCVNDRCLFLPYYVLFIIDVDDVCVRVRIRVCLAIMPKSSLLSKLKGGVADK